MSKKKDERQFKIRQLLQEHPKIKISDLADYFQTSSETIRKDIIELEDSKIIKKEHGYALLLEEPDEMPISLRNQEYIEEKKQIMKKACTFIKEGMVVYLDAGSTCLAGIPFLQSIHNITIVTNSIFVAYKCAKLNKHVILIGGNISNNAYRSYGNFASETIDYIHIDVAILGTKGFKDNVYSHINYTSGLVALTGECINGHHDKGIYRSRELQRKSRPDSESYGICYCGELQRYESTSERFGFG